SDASISTLLERIDPNGPAVDGMCQAVGVGRTIVPDNAAAAHELATALIVEGHRRFAVVKGIAGIPSAADRTGGFIAALTEAGIEPELDVEADLTREGGYRLAERIQSHLETAPTGEDLPLCVFAPADVMALGALGELRRREIDVPGQVSVAGFGGVPEGEDSHPTLTTIALPLHEMARQAVQWVLEHPSADAPDDDSAAETPAAAPADVHVRGDVLLRGSTTLGSAD
ncbi:MAG: substrate-binding domain-containing protein, partial [Brachybacterium sp.]|nr:substrate-binding domain-containing protein [Brachybacterium sp.]